MNAPDPVRALANSTTVIADAALATKYAKLDAASTRVAKQALLDWWACTIAAAHDPLVEMLVAAARADESAPTVPVIGRRERVSRRDGAHINGAASHALDYDDVNLAFTGHPTVVLVPALLAYAHGRGVSGRDFLTAFCAGYDTICRVGVLAGPTMYAHGFHATGVCGAFGAASAVNQLAGGGRATLLQAFGIAGTQAAGLKANFGTMCKPLHAGLAARTGYEAATLAARGFTSRPDILDCEQGFIATHSRERFPEATAGAAPNGHYVRDNLFKYHAACYMTHAPIEAALAVRRQSAFALDRVRRVTLRVVHDADRMCNIVAPRTGLESKFSLRQTIAMALSDVDTAGLANYSEAIAARPDLVALREKIDVDLRRDRDVGGPWGQTYAEVDVELTDGRVLTAAYDSGIPATDLDAQERKLLTKFHALVVPVLGEARSRELAVATLALESATDLDAITRLAIPT
jgi:2-methylcitrate dehydratase PrpD